MKIVRIHTQPHELLLARPLNLAGGSLGTARDAWLIGMEASSGHTAWIDVSALNQEQNAAIQAEMDQITRQPLISQVTDDKFTLTSRIYFDLVTHALAAITSGVTLRRHWNLASAQTVETNFTLDLVSADEARGLAEEARGHGYGTLKLKLGRSNPVDDIAVVEAVRQVHPRATLRGDANGAWDHGTAVDLLAALESFGWEYIEQPVAGVETMALLRGRTNVPLALDEGLREQDGYARALACQAADYWVLKPTLMGSLPVTLRVIGLATQAGIAPVISSTFDGPLTLAALAHLAAAWAPPGLVTGLDDSHLAPESRLRSSRGPFIRPDDISFTNDPLGDTHHGFTISSAS